MTKKLTESISDELEAQTCPHCGYYGDPNEAHTCNRSRPEPTDFPKEFRNVINSYIRGNAGKYLIASYSRTACDIIESQTEQLKDKYTISKEDADHLRKVSSENIDLKVQLAAANKEIERLKKARALWRVKALKGHEDTQ